MTKQEIVKLLLIIKAEYPREHVGINEATTKAQVELWHTMLNEFDVKLVFASFQKHIASQEGCYKPSIHHLLKNLNTLKNGEQKTAGEAWEQVLDSVRKYGVYEQSYGVSCLDSFTQKIVRMIGYREICLSENIETLRAQFRMFYESKAKKDKEFNNMPSHLKEIQMTYNRLGMHSIQSLLKNGGTE